MTDRIDLDELETDADDESAEGNDGDWLWRDDAPGEPEREPDAPSRGPATDADRTDGTNGNGDRRSEADESEAERDSDRTSEPAPHVPKTGDKMPAGIPMQGDDSAGTAGGRGGSAAGTDADASAPETPRPMGSGGESESTSASGPHGGGTDDMTMALTYDAVRRLERPRRVFGDAGGWADWIGIVGDVPAHVVQKFQREHGIDADFFNGSGTAPGERLAEIDRNSMFYADRMVVVGVAGADEPIAEAADWEFVPLETAAEKADWDLEPDSSA